MAISHHFQRLPQARLDQLLAQQAVLDDTIDELWEIDHLNLEIVRSWQLLHLLLAGAPWARQGPLANAVLGGAVIPDSDSGHGPYRYNSAREVRALASRLHDIDFEVLWSRFDLARVRSEQIYPEDWSGQADDRRECEEDYEALRAFLASAARAGEGTLMFLS